MRKPTLELSVCVALIALVYTDVVLVDSPMKLRPIAMSANKQITTDSHTLFANIQYSGTRNDKTMAFSRKATRFTASFHLAK